MQNWNQWQLPAATVTAPMPQPPIGYAAPGADPMATMQSYLQYYNQPAPSGYTAEQWAAAQQQNWVQWQTWQQQYQQWQAQYGEKYQETMKQMSSQGLPGLGQIPPSPITQPPPLPKEDTSVKPPLPPDSGAYGVPPPHQNNLPLFPSKQSANPPLPPGQPPLPSDNSQTSGNDGNLNGKRVANSNVDAGSAKKLKIEDDELTHAEKTFDAQFKQWEEQFNKWKQQNANHPDKTQYKQYEAKWTSWREKLIERREQMRRKREQQKQTAAKAEAEKNKTMSGDDKILNILSSTENQGLINNLLGIGKTLGLTGKQEIPGTPSVQPPAAPTAQPTDPQNPMAMGAPIMTANMNQAAWAAQQWAAQYNAGMNIPNFGAGYQQAPVIPPSTTNASMTQLPSTNFNQLPINFNQPPGNFNQTLGNYTLPPPGIPAGGPNMSNMPPNFSSSGPNFSQPPPAFVSSSGARQQSGSDQEQRSAQDTNPRSFRNDGEQRERAPLNRDSMGSSDERSGFERNRMSGPPPNNRSDINRGDQFGFSDNYGRDRPNKDFGSSNQCGSGSDNHRRDSSSGRDFSPSSRTGDDFRSNDRLGNEKGRFDSGFDRDQGNRFEQDSNRQEYGNNRFGSDRDSLNPDRFNNSNDRFGSNNDRFSSGNDRFGSSNDRLESVNDRLGSGNDRLGSGNDRLGSGNDRFSSGNDRFGSGNDRSGSGNDRFGSDNNRFGSDNNRFGSGDNRFGSGNDRFNKDNDRFGFGNDRSGADSNRSTLGTEQSRTGDRFRSSSDRCSSDNDKVGFAFGDRFGSMNDKPGLGGDRLGQPNDKFGRPPPDRFDSRDGSRDAFGLNSKSFGRNNQFDPPDDMSPELKKLMEKRRAAIDVFKPSNFGSFLDLDRNKTAGTSLSESFRKITGDSPFSSRSSNDLSNKDSFASRGPLSRASGSGNSDSARDLRPGDNTDFNFRGPGDFRPRGPGDRNSRGPGDFLPRGNEFGLRDADEIGGLRRSGDFTSKSGQEFEPRMRTEFKSTGDLGSPRKRNEQRDNRRSTSENSERMLQPPMEEGLPSQPEIDSKGADEKSRLESLGPNDSNSGPSNLNVPPLQMPPWMDPAFDNDDVVEIPPDKLSEPSMPSFSNADNDDSEIPANSRAASVHTEKEPHDTPVASEKKSDVLPFMGENDPKPEDLNMEPPPELPNLGPVIKRPDSPSQDRAGNSSGPFGPHAEDFDARLPFNTSLDSQGMQLGPKGSMPTLGPRGPSDSRFPPFGPRGMGGPPENMGPSGLCGPHGPNSGLLGPRGPHDDRFNIRGPLPEVVGPRGLGDFGPRGLGNFGPRGPGNLGPRGLGDFGPRGLGDSGPRGPGNFGPQGPVNFGPRGPSDVGPGGPGDVGPREPGDFDHGGRGNFGPCGQPDFGSRSPINKQFGARDSVDRPFGPRGPLDRPFDTCSSNDRPFGSHGPNNKPFGPHGPNDGPFGPRGPNDGPFGPHGPNDGAFGPHGPHDGPFGPRGPNDGPFASRGLNDGPFGPRGPNDGPFGPRGPNDGPFGPRGPNDRPFGPRGPNDGSFGPRGPNDGPFGLRGSNDGPFGLRGPNDGPFGPHGPNDKPLGLHGPNDGPFGPRGPNDGPFGPRGPNDGPFGPRGNNDGPFGPRGPNDGPFGPSGPNDGPYGPRGPNDGPFGPRGPNDGPFGPHGPNDGPFGPHGPNDGPFEPRGPSDCSFGPRGPDENPFCPRGPNDPSFGSRGLNDAPCAPKQYGSNTSGPRGNFDTPQGPIPSLMSFKFDKPKPGGPNDAPPQKNDDLEANQMQDLPPAFRASDNSQGDGEKLDTNMGSEANSLSSRGPDWKQSLTRNKFGDFDQRTEGSIDLAEKHSAQPDDVKEIDRKREMSSDIAGKDKPLYGPDDQMTDKGGHNIKSRGDRMNPGFDEPSAGSNDKIRGVIPNFISRRTNDRRGMCSGPLKEFCIEKQFNYNHSGGVPDEILTDHTPAKVIDYAHATRVVVKEYVSPAQCFDYGHGRLKPNVPDHEIYSNQDFRGWVENEHNLKEYMDRMKVYESDLKTLNRGRPAREGPVQFREPTWIQEERRSYERDRRSRNDRNRRDRDTDDYRDRERERESRERGRIEREREWERISNKHREDRSHQRRSSSRDRTRERPEKVRKESDRENNRDDERSKGNVSGQESSAKKPDESTSQDNSQDEVTIVETTVPPATMEPPNTMEPPTTMELPKTPNFTMIDDLLCPPGRQNRPPKLVIILRGPPGSGKSFVAKLIKDKEVEQGGSAPRILSLDDYFLTEKEVETVDDNGKKVTTKEMVYEYEEAMEASYITSLIKAFKKNITDGFFNFIILDSMNEKISDYEEMWSFAKTKGFRVYVCEMEMDVQICLKRNIHNRTEDEVNRIVDYFEPTPSYHQKLDVTSMLQEEAIEEVHMEDSEEVENTETPANDDSQDSQEDQDCVCISKWETMDADDKLDRLDGLAKRKNEGKTQTMEDFLQVPDYYNMEDTSGKKRVRWADLEERKEQEKMRAVGFVVGQTNWDRMMDPTKGGSALTRTKYI